MTTLISSALADAITAHAAAAHPLEACGLLLGTPGRITELRSAANVADDPAIRFEIDPATLLAAHRAARNGGPAVIGSYHSHPRGRSDPSAEDARQAAPDGQLWLIAGAGGLALWRAVPVGVLHDRFVPEPLVRVA